MHAPEPAGLAAVATTFVMLNVQLEGDGGVGAPTNVRVGTTRLTNSFVGATFRIAGLVRRVVGLAHAPSETPSSSTT